MSIETEMARLVLDEILTKDVGGYELNGSQATITLFNGGRFTCNVESISWIRTLDEHNVDVADWSIAKFQNLVYNANNNPAPKPEVKVEEVESPVEGPVDKNGDVFDPEVHDVTAKGTPRKVFGVWAKRK